MSSHPFQWVLFWSIVCIVVGCAPTVPHQEDRAALIRQAKVTNGMTKAQVRLSVGNPRSIDQLVTGTAIIETWRYGSGCSLSFLTFRNGILDSMYKSGC